MANYRKEKESSLAELLIRAYEKSCPTLDFGEIKNQEAALQWASWIIEKARQNEGRAKNNGE